MRCVHRSTHGDDSRHAEDRCVQGRPLSLAGVPQSQDEASLALPRRARVVRHSGERAQQRLVVPRLRVSLRCREGGEGVLAVMKPGFVDRWLSRRGVRSSGRVCRISGRVPALAARTGRAENRHASRVAMDFRRVASQRTAAREMHLTARCSRRAPCLHMPKKRSPRCFGDAWPDSRRIDCCDSSRRSEATCGSSFETGQERKDPVTFRLFRPERALADRSLATSTEWLECASPRSREARYSVHGG